MQMHGGSITQCVVVSIGQTAYVYSVLRSFLSVSRCQMCAVWPGLAIRPVMPKPPLREHRFRPLHCVLCICVYVRRHSHSSAASKRGIHFFYDTLHDKLDR